MLESYLQHMPNRVNYYFDPFVGGGAMLGYVLERYKPITKVWINDANEELIHFWRYLQQDPYSLIGAIDALGEEYLRTPLANRRDFYFHVRQQNADKKWKDEEAEPVDLAAYFYFLIKTCFNGFYQTNHNTNERFGTPPGTLTHLKPFWDCEELARWGDAIKHITITCGDWRHLVYEMKPSTFYFFDPPYRGAQLKKGYSYGFTDADLDDLLHFADLQSRYYSVDVMICNRDTGDGFLDKWAGKFNMARFGVSYALGRGKNSSPGQEILFYRNGNAGLVWK
jgi:DNA adenine methylase